MPADRNRAGNSLSAGGRTARDRHSACPFHAPALMNDRYNRLPMDTTMEQQYSPLMLALGSRRPHDGLADKLQLYGQFVGSWDIDVDFHALDGSRRWSAMGEVHFDWVLQGTAIQDVFIIPARRQRAADQPPEPWYRYGTTFRWYDPRIDAWHITFLDPLRSV